MSVEHISIRMINETTMKLNKRNILGLYMDP